MTFSISLRPNSPAPAPVNEAARPVANRAGTPPTARPASSAPDTQHGNSRSRYFDRIPLPLQMGWRQTIAEHGKKIPDDLYEGLSQLEELPVQRGEFSDDTPRQARLLRARYLASRVIRQDLTLTEKELCEAAVKMTALHDDGDRRKLVAQLLNWPAREHLAAVRDALEYKYDHLSASEQYQLQPSDDIGAALPDPERTLWLEALLVECRTLVKKVREHDGWDSSGLNDDELARLQAGARKILKNVCLVDPEVVFELRNLQYRIPGMKDILSKGMYFQADRLNNVEFETGWMLPETRGTDFERTPEPFTARLGARDAQALKDYANSSAMEINPALIRIAAMRLYEELLDEKPDTSEFDADDKQLLELMATLEKKGLGYSGPVRKGVCRHYSPSDFRNGQPVMLPAYCSTTDKEHIAAAYVEKKAPFAIEFASSSAVNMSAAVASRGRQVAEILYRKNTWFLPLEQGFDPRYVNGLNVAKQSVICDNGMYVVWVKEMPIPAQLKAWSPAPPQDGDPALIELHAGVAAQLRKMLKSFAEDDEWDDLEKFLSFEKIPMSHCLDTEDKTRMMLYAAAADRFDVARRLLEAGADPELKIEEISLVDAAQISQNPQLYDLLDRCGLALDRVTDGTGAADDAHRTSAL